MRFRDRVNYFSFILTVLVVLLHSTGIFYPVVPISLWTWSFLKLGDALGEFAVPGFFALSGYLFFRNVPAAGSARGIIGAKLGRRVRTLLIPFLCWNLIYYIIYLVFGRAEPGISEAVEAIFMNSCNVVFWYLRQLIILSVLTPIIFILCRRARTAVIVLILFFFAAACYEHLPLHIVNEDALFYFTAGASASLHLRDRIESSSENFDWAAVILSIAAIFACCFIPEAVKSIEFQIGGLVAMRLLAVIAMWFLLCYVTAGRIGLHAPDFMKYDFFIYATHYLEIRFFMLIFSPIYQLGEAAAAACYIIVPVLSIAVSIVAARLMKRFMPAVYIVLTGGRG